ncbi:MAG TPA: GNAT family N-acetyltransferase [Firmicutes bacterium]|nr:GNAT family N-acetyltransferase [Candidatus Fermentithermobacillaceae bacterium]
MLYGEKTRLRPPEMTDLDNIMAWINDREVTRNLAIGFWPLSRKAEEAWLAKTVEGSDPRNRVLVIEDLQGTYLGSIGLHDIDMRSGVAEVGIVIGRKDYWGKGYGTDALRTLLRFAFANLRLRKVYLKVFGSNARAQKSYAKLGFKVAGRLKEHELKEGEYEDVIYMELFRDELK